MPDYLVHIGTPQLTLKAKPNVFPVWPSDGPRTPRASKTQQSRKSRQSKSWQGGLCDENVDDNEDYFDDHHIVAVGFILGRTVKH